MGMITDSRTVSALAPGKLAETCTVGGAISGYWVTGRVERPRTPRINITMETTVDNTGLSIKVFNISYVVANGFDGLGDAVEVNALRLHRSAIAKRPHTSGNYLVAALNSPSHYDQIIYPVAHLYHFRNCHCITLYNIYMYLSLLFEG